MEAYVGMQSLVLPTKLLKLSLAAGPRNTYKKTSSGSFTQAKFEKQ